MPVLTDIELVWSNTGDEVVYHFKGDGAIGWSLRAISEAIPYGGNAIQKVAGSSIIQVDLIEVLPSLPGFGSQPRRYAESELENVVEVIEMPPLDSVVQTFIGLRSAQSIDVTERASADGRQLVVSVSPE